jgi:hypothetical protein
MRTPKGSQKSSQDQHFVQLVSGHCLQLKGRRHLCRNVEERTYGFDQVRRRWLLRLFLGA